MCTWGGITDAWIKDDATRGKGSVHNASQHVFNQQQEILVLLLPFQSIYKCSVPLWSLWECGYVWPGSGFGPFALLFRQIHVRHVHSPHEGGVRVAAQGWLVLTAG